MSSNVNVSDLCPLTHSSIKFLTTNQSVDAVGAQLNDHPLIFSLPLIGSELTRLTPNLLVSTPSESSSVSNIQPMSAMTSLSGGTTIVQIDASNLNLFQTNDTNIGQTLFTSNIFEITDESTHYVLQNDSSDANSQLTANNVNSNHSIDDNNDNQRIEPIVRQSSKSNKNRLTTQITAVLADEEVANDWLNNNETECDFIKSDNLFQCNYCSLQLNRLKEMRRHIRLHIEDKPYKCSECDQTFNVEINLRLHKCGLHFKSSTGLKPTCCECNKGFTRLASLKSHLSVHQMEELLSCSYCSQQFSTPFHLNKHLKSDHMSGHKKSSSKSTAKPLVSKNEFICSVCNQKFANNSLLKEHQKLHLKINSSLKHRTYKKWIDRSDFRHKCLTCGKAFKKNSQLIRHNRIHSGEKPYVCEFCGTAFNQKSSLDIHRSKHTGERKHQCKFCGALFNQSGNMRNHIRRLHAPQVDTPFSQLFKCPHCSCVFKRLGILNCHISRRHPLEANKTINSNNNKLSVNNQINISLMSGVDDTLGDLLSKVLEKSGVKSNIEDIGDKQIAQLFDPATGTRQTHILRRVGKISYRQCLYCQKEFKKSSDLVRHYRIHTHDKPFKCSQCYRAFTVKGTLSAHMRTHDGLKPFMCQLCNKSFSTSQSLKVHTRLHTGALPYTCSLCEKTFRTLGHLKSHSTSHQRQSQSSNTCVKSTKSRPEIDETLLSKIHLDGPLLLVTDGSALNEANSDENMAQSEGTDDKRKHKCSHCEKAFKKSSHLTQHIRSHTGEKPYQCEICLQCFVAKGSLKTHSQIHSNLKPFKCSECQFAFSTRGSLTRHMTRHSNERPFMCPYCAKTFKSSLNCKKHIKLHRTEFAIHLMNEQNQINVENAVNTSEQSLLTKKSTKAVSLIERNTNQMSTTEPTFDANNVCLNTEYSQPLNVQQLENFPIEQTNTQQTEQPSALDSAIPDGQSPNCTVRTVGVDGLRPFHCQECDASFKKSSHLKQHERRHTGERPFKCEICLREFATKGVLNTHINTHSSAKNHRCDICSATFVSNNSLRRHMNTVHTNHVCPHCPVKCKSQPLLKKHIETKHQNLIRDNQLTIDPSITTITTQIPVSSLTVDSCLQPSDPFVEQSTNKLVLFESVDQSVYTKMNDKTEIEVKTSHSNKCDFCPKTFKKPSDLQRHRRIHTGEKPFICNICSKRFTVKSTLDCHLITHKGVKNFNCDICGAAFATNGSLKVHTRLHTGLKPFECNQCGERFRTSGHRKAHIDKHNKNKIGNESENQTSNVPQIITKLSQLGQTSELSVTELNQNIGTDVLRFALTTTPSQTIGTNSTFQMESAIFSQLFQMDSSLIQQLQSQGFTITESDGSDINNESSMTTIASTALF